MAECRRRAGASVLGGETNRLGDVWRPHNTTRVSHSSLPASGCHCFCEDSRVCQSTKSVMASASLSGGMNAIMRTVSIAVPMKTRLVVGPSTLAIGTPSACVTA